MTGFVTPDSQVWGRPVGVAVADGSLLVTDDGSNSIWRIDYAGTRLLAAPAAVDLNGPLSLHPQFSSAVVPIGAEGVSVLVSR